MIYSPEEDVILGLMFPLSNFDANKRLFFPDSSRQLETWTKNAFLLMMLLTCSLSWYFFHTIAVKLHIPSVEPFK